MIDLALYIVSIVIVLLAGYCLLLVCGGLLAALGAMLGLILREPVAAVLRVLDAVGDRLYEAMPAWMRLK